MILKGRRRIITNKEINKENLIDILNESLSIHNANVEESKRLIDYYLGKQDILDRPETEMSDINNKVVINYAYSSERDIQGYTFGKDVEIMSATGKNRREIKKLVDIMKYENSDLVDQEVSLLAGITGLAYYCVLPSREIRSDYMPEVPIQLHAADVFNTFVVRSNDIGNPVVMSVIYRTDKKYTYYTCFTDTMIWNIKSLGYNSLSMINNEITESVNPIGLNPIIAAENNLFLMGDFEVAITLFNAINNIASDSVNDVENVIKSLLVLIGAELEESEVPLVKKNRILQLLGTPGVNLDAKFIYQQLDADGIKNLRENFEEAYKIVLGIPDRKTRGGGGGDTGDAVELRDGWADIEVVARNKEQYIKVAKKKEVGVVIRILQLLGELSEKLSLKDIDVKYPRNKRNNLQSKAQSFATLHGTHVFDPVDTLSMVNLTNDIEETIERGNKYWNERQQETLIQQQNSDGSTNTSNEANNNENKVEDKKEGE